MTRARGSSRAMARTIAAVSSRDRSLTTMTSMATPCWASSARTVGAIVSASSRAAITTDTRTGAGPPAAGGGSSGASRRTQRWWYSCDAAVATNIAATRPKAAVAIHDSGASGIDAEVLGALLLEERDRAGHLVEAVDAVLDRDPAGEAGAGEDAEDGVVVVQAASRLAVQQLGRIAGAAVGGAQVVEGGARREVAIGGVHRDHAMLDLLEERDRIEAADGGVRWIELHAEGGRVEAADDLEEDVLGLGELRVMPGAVLVVVLHAQDDATLFGVLDRADQTVERPRDAVGPRHPRIALAAQRAAMTAAEPQRQVDGRA